MSRIVLDDDRTAATEAQLTPDVGASPRRAAMDKVIPIPTILSVVAISISFGACAWVTFYNPGISNYDFFYAREKPFFRTRDWSQQRLSCSSRVDEGREFRPRNEGEAEDDQGA